MRAASQLKTEGASEVQASEGKRSRFSPVLVSLLLTAMATPGLAGKPPRVKKPRLDLRATPRVAFTPVDVHAVAELVGGEDVEEFYCPGVQWDWGDGTRSAQEGDCPPFEPGMEMARRYFAHHAYRVPGHYSVRVTLRRVDRALAVATTRVIVQGGFSASNSY